MPRPGTLCPDRLAASFEGLGDRCEFGIVQRFCGIEPLGLLRFSTMPHAYLSSLINTGFALLDRPEAITVRLHPDDAEWWGYVDLCGMTYHTGRDSTQVAHAEALRGERRRLPFLKRKLLEDLAEADKIFLRRDPGRGRAEIATVLAALRDYGPNDLLWVDQTTDPAEASRVEALQAGLARGCLDRFWPYGAPDPDGLRQWLELLERALALLRPARWKTLCADAEAMMVPADAALLRLEWRCLSAARAEIVAAPAPAKPGLPVIRHSLLRETSPDTGLITCCEAASLAPACLYVVSAWVWVPPDFSGWIGMAFLGLPWIKMWPADMQQRGTWQRLATSVRLPAEPGVYYPGLVAVAQAGSHFMSTGWRLERGVAPTPPWYDGQDRQGREEVLF